MQHREGVGSEPPGPGVAVPGREDHRHPVRLQLPSREEQRVPGCRIQPMGVIDDTQHRPLVRRFGEDGKGGHAHQERLDLGAVAILLPERDAKRSRLGRR